MSAFTQGNRMIGQADDPKGSRSAPLSCGAGEVVTAAEDGSLYRVVCGLGPKAVQSMGPSIRIGEAPLGTAAKTLALAPLAAHPGASPLEHWPHLHLSVPLRSTAGCSSDMVAAAQVYCRCVRSISDCSAMRGTGVPKRGGGGGGGGAEEGGLVWI